MQPENNPQTPNQQSYNNQLGPDPGQVYGPSGSQNQQPSQTPKPPEPHNYDTSSSKKTKKIIIILGGLIGIFIIAAIIAVITGGGNDPKENVVEENTAQNDLYKEPSAIEIENLNNSVSDDITNLSTDADFPSDKLSDDNLDL